MFPNKKCRYLAPREDALTRSRFSARCERAQNAQDQGGSMGLAIGVGVLADLIVHDAEGAEWTRRSIAGLNKVLVANGLAEHHEPERVPALRRRSVTSYPYSFLHYLRRAYACIVRDERLRTGEMTEDDFEFVQDVAVDLMDSHLLSHSDAEGFYVPQAFHDPLCDNALPGGFAGSIPQLLKELQRVAVSLGISLKDGQLLPAEEDKLVKVEDGEPFYREKIVWFSLYEACKLCMAHGTLLVFH